MDAPQLPATIEQLSDNLDDVEAALKPLLNSPINETFEKHSLLERAQLCVLVTSTIESLLYCVFTGNILEVLATKPSSLAASPWHRCEESSGLEGAYAMQTVL